MECVSHIHIMTRRQAGGQAGWQAYVTAESGKWMASQHDMHANEEAKEDACEGVVGRSGACFADLLSFHAFDVDLEM